MIKGFVLKDNVADVLNNAQEDFDKGLLHGLVYILKGEDGHTTVSWAGMSHLELLGLSALIKQATTEYQSGGSLDE